MKNFKGVTIIELLFVAAIFIMMLVILTPFADMARVRNRRISCENNLRKISLGLLAYAADHEEMFPKELKELYPIYVSDQSVFDCPGCKSAGSPDAPDYKYTIGYKVFSPAKEVIVEDLDGSHRRQGKNVLRVDGSVDWVRSAR